MRLRIAAVAPLIVAVCAVLGSAARLGAAPADELPLPASDPGEVGMSGERLERIVPRMQHYIDRKLVPGVVTFVARHGRIVHFEALGMADVERNVPMSRDAIFRIASMTKPITSVALMMLWEEGRFQLNDPVAEFLPEFRDMKVSTTGDVSAKSGKLLAAEKPITIRMLLTHTAGLANNYFGNTEAYGAAMDVPEGTNDRLDAYVKRLAALPLNYQPGAEWQYSHATDVVGRLVEVISGEPFDQFLADRIFGPLGMTDTAFFFSAEDGARLAAQYRPGADSLIVPDDPGGAASRWVTGPKTLFRGAGGLASTIGDYARFAQLMLNGGELDGVRLLSPQTVSLMFENHTGEMPIRLAGPGFGFGLGFAVTTDRGAAASPLSNGSAWWGGAYCTSFWIDAEEELIAILMTQVRPNAHLDIAQDFQVLVNQAIVN